MEIKIQNSLDNVKAVYLTFEKKKFWEASLYKDRNQTQIRCGKLNKDGTEAFHTTESLMRKHQTLDLARQYIKSSVQKKIEKGYEFQDKDFLDFVNLSLEGKSNENSPKKSSPAPNLKQKSTDNIQFSSKKVKINDFQSENSNTSSLKIPQIPENLDSSADELSHQPPSNLSEEDRSPIALEKKYGQFIQQEVEFNKPFDSFLSQIEQKVIDYEMLIDIKGQKMFLCGFEKRVLSFIKFVQDLIDNQEIEIRGEYTQKEIALSEKILRFKKNEIEEKASKMNIVVEFTDKHYINVLGFQKDVDEYCAYVQTMMQTVDEELKSQPPSPNPSQDVQIKEMSFAKDEQENMERLPSIDFSKFSQLKPVSERTLVISCKAIQAIARILQVIDELQIKADVDPIEKLIVVEKNCPKIDKLTDFIFEIEQEGEKGVSRREFSLPEETKKDLYSLANKIQHLDLSGNLMSEKMQVMGRDNSIGEFMLWILEKEVAKEKIFSRQASLNDDSLIQKEITISTFHRVKEEVIKKYAEKHDLIIDFGYEIVLVAGKKNDIDKFTNYLFEIETAGKKSLYPEYWDFTASDQTFQKFEIPDTEIEFQKVAERFNDTLIDFKIVKLERIQNRFLIEHYVTMIQKRMELNPNKSINRKMLFHGTRWTDPEKIYKNMDTGFDLQYAAQGLFGKGIYFAVNSNYSHSFAYTSKFGILKRSQYQMIMADVFVGNPYNHQGGRYRASNYVKAPQGYDSVYAARSKHYILYNNLHSYPLYLITYEDRRHPGQWCNIF